MRARAKEDPFFNTKLTVATLGLISRSSTVNAAINASISAFAKIDEQSGLYDSKATDFKVLAAKTADALRTSLGERFDGALAGMGTWVVHCKSRARSLIHARNVNIRIARDTLQGQKLQSALARLMPRV